MTGPVLSLRNVGKCYASYRNNVERFATWFGAHIEPCQVFWASRNITFDVGPGQALAVIGANGAGKSTLLKMITGTIRPTVGTIAVGGRISAILELGIGFNLELTGRQNVYQAGGLMGFSANELSNLMPQIEAFAEIREFFDRPLRTYSSGMQARLAFSLATAKQPDILIVDEVLSVGDSYFQHKSFDRIRLFKGQGCSILLVTHALSDVRALCDRVLLLDKGVILKDGPPDEVVDYYNAMIAEKDNARTSIEQRRLNDDWSLTRSGSFEAVTSSLVLLDADTLNEVATARVGQRLLLRLVAQIREEIPQLVLGYMLRDRTGHVVWGTNTHHTNQIVRRLASGSEIQFDLAFTCALGPGSYAFSPALVSSDTHLERNFEWTDNALVFDVVNADRPTFIGTTALDATFDIGRQLAMANDVE